MARHESGPCAQRSKKRNKVQRIFAEIRTHRARDRIQFEDNVELEETRSGEKKGPEYIVTSEICRVMHASAFEGFSNDKFGSNFAKSLGGICNSAN